MRAAAVGHALLSAASLFYLLGLLGASYRLELWTATAYGWWAALTLVAVAVLVGWASTELRWAFSVRTWRRGSKRSGTG